MRTRTARTAHLAALILALAPHATSTRAETAPSAAPNLPADAATHVRRRTECHHWMGEDAYDAARGRQIAAAIEALRCASVEAYERRLRRRYRLDPAVLRAFDRARDADG